MILALIGITINSLISNSFAGFWIEILGLLSFLTINEYCFGFRLGINSLSKQCKVNIMSFFSSIFLLNFLSSICKFILLSIVLSQAEFKFLSDCPLIETLLPIGICI